VQLLILIPPLLFLFWMIFAVLSIVKGAPFVITPKAKRDIILEFAEIHEGDVSVDIGSGSGSIVMTLAEAGAQAHGYEINLLLVMWSRMVILYRGLKGKALIHWANFWRADFSSFSVVTVYGISHIMSDLEKKLDAELRPGTRVISNTFRFPNWVPVKEKDGVILYIKK
jgi:hypothetical protein